MAVDYFLRIDGIEGESTDADHNKWIDVHSYSWGVETPALDSSAPRDRTSGKVNFIDLGILKSVDRATPDLMIHCANGKRIPTVELEGVRTGGERHTFVKYVLNDCMVSSVNDDGTDSSQERPSEAVTFRYRKVTVEYRPIDQAGTPTPPVSRGWDIETNREV